MGHTCPNDCTHIQAPYGPGREAINPGGTQPAASRRGPEDEPYRVRMPETPRTIDDIHGWFWAEDRVLFSHFLGADSVRATGDLVELGTFKGKSAVLIGDYLAEGERFFALDLFHNSTDAANAFENRYYPTLTRDAFESNYLAFHDRLPEIIEGPSTLIVDHVEPHSVRFFHIDASHLYEHVAADLRSASRLVAPGGVVVLDDYRAVHTPGVPAAAWEAVLTLGFKPFLLSPQKMYGTFDDDTTEHRRRVVRLLDHDPRWSHEAEEILGNTVIRAAFDEAETQSTLASVHQRLAQLDHRLAQLPVIETRLTRLDKRLARAGKIRDRQFNALREGIERGSLGLRVLRRLRG